MCGRKLLCNRWEHDVRSVRGNDGLSSAKLNLVRGVCRRQLLLRCQRNGVCGLLSRQLLLRRRQYVLTVRRRQLLSVGRSSNMRHMPCRRVFRSIQRYYVLGVRRRQLLRIRWSHGVRCVRRGDGLHRE